jgi:hypothetical protein
LDSGKLEEGSAQLCIRRPAVVLENDQQKSNEVPFHVARLDTASAFKAAKKEADKGNLKKGRECLERALKQVERSETASQSLSLDLAEKYVSLKVSHEYCHLAHFPYIP